MPTAPDLDIELDTVPEGSDAGPDARSRKGAFAVVRAVLDGYTFRILMATHERECTALDLSRRFGIPIVACYRRLRQLQELGVLVPSRRTTSSPGHFVRHFRSHLRSARIVFEDGRLRARIELAPPGWEGEPEGCLEETFDRGPVRRKRSRAPRDLGCGGTSLELVAQSRQGALDAGEAGG